MEFVRVQGVIQGANYTAGLAGYVSGGLIGYMGATSTAGTRARVYRSFSSGSVTGSSAVGGLVGAVNHAANNMVFDSYWDTETSGQSESARGTGQDTATMQSEIGYPDFNFTTRWTIDEGNAYPELRDMSAYPQPQTVNLADLDGNGTAVNPYIILTLDHLNAVRQDVAAHYRLGADIDATPTVAWDAGQGWTPVGASGNAFSGSFNGGGFTIANLTVNRPTTDYQGLFGYLSGAHVQRLRLENANVQGAQYTGGLAGYALGGTIEFIELTGEVNGGGHTGGLLACHQWLRDTGRRCRGVRTGRRPDRRDYRLRARIHHDPPCLRTGHCARRELGRRVGGANSPNHPCR